MTEQYKPVEGDRVRITFEAEVKQVYSDGDLRVDLVDNYATDIPHEGNFSIEKIEPPVEVFKPGDVVRRKDGFNEGVTLGLGITGYIHLNHGSLGEFVEYGLGYSQEFFTSANFERVTLS